VYNEERVIGLAEGKNAYQFSFQIMNQPVALAFGSEQASVSEINVRRPRLSLSLRVLSQAILSIKRVVPISAGFSR
jgi:hypothetical protein